MELRFSTLVITPELPKDFMGYNTVAVRKKQKSFGSGVGGLTRLLVIAKRRKAIHLATHDGKRECGHLKSSAKLICPRIGLHVEPAY